MYPLTIENNQQLEQLARVFYKVWQTEDENGLVSLHQIASERNVDYDTVARWIEKAGIKKHAFGRGKAIRRKDLRKLP